MLGDDLVDDSSPRRCNEAAPLSTPKPRLVSLIRLGFFYGATVRTLLAAERPNGSRRHRGEGEGHRSRPGP